MIKKKKQYTNFYKIAKNKKFKTNKKLRKTQIKLIKVFMNFIYKDIQKSIMHVKIFLMLKNPKKERNLL